MTTAWHSTADLSVRTGEHQAQPPGQRHGVLLRATVDAEAAQDLAMLNSLHDRASRCGTDTAAILQLARDLGDSVPLPQQGRTLALWEILGTLGAAGLTVARIVEPHLDALAILAQAQQEELNTSGSTWGVFAAQGPGQPLTATRGTDGWVLSGDKPWCSLAESLSHALVTARRDSRRDGENTVGLFAVDLRHPGITRAGRPWQALGLPTVPSPGLSLSGVPAVSVGAPDWYLRRPGFAWGGAGVAAIWHGAATAVARRLYQHTRSRTPDQIALWHLGTADQALWSARAAFQAAAALADAAQGGALHDGAPAALTAGRLRATVVAAAETILSVAAHGMGPAPLAFEAEHAQRVADLELYLRQDHAERSLAGNGAALLGNGSEDPPGVAPW